MYLLAMMNEIWAPVGLSLKVSLIASCCAFGTAGFVAWKMAGWKGKGRLLVETLFMLPMILPPTVVGLLLLVVLGRSSFIGGWIETITGMPIVFTWQGAVIAAAVVAFPLAYQTVKAGFASIDGDLLAAGRSMGASERQLLVWVIIPMTKRMLLTAFVLSFARALGEFGATLMIAGNIPGRTQTLPTAIYMAVESGDMTMAFVWAMITIVISFLLLVAVGRPATDGGH